jgi:hypothetical protein
MAEGEQRKLNSQHVADRRFHGWLLPVAAAGRPLIVGFDWSRCSER